MHIQQQCRARVENDCSIGRFTIAVSVDAFSAVTGWSEHMIYQWAREQDVKLHQCHDVDYLPGNLLLRHLVHRAPHPIDANTALRQATDGLCAVLTDQTTPQKLGQLRAAMRDSLAIMTTLNEPHLGKDVDIAAALRRAFRPEMTASQRWPSEDQANI